MRKNLGRYCCRVFILSELHFFVVFLFFGDFIAWRWVVFVGVYVAAGSVWASQLARDWRDWPVWLPVPGESSDTGHEGVLVPDCSAFALGVSSWAVKLMTTG